MRNHTDQEKNNCLAGDLLTIYREFAWKRLVRCITLYRSRKMVLSVFYAIYETNVPVRYIRSLYKNKIWPPESMKLAIQKENKLWMKNKNLYRSTYLKIQYNEYDVIAISHTIFSWVNRKTFVSLHHSTVQTGTICYLRQTKYLNISMHIMPTCTWWTIMTLSIKIFDFVATKIIFFCRCFLRRVFSSPML